jgi:hypothetical protein
MNRFLLKIFIFSFFPLLTLYGVLLLENGTTDPFYQRFTSPKQSALILGNSKAAQGIIPAVLDKKLSSEFGTKIYNYSFTVNNSPFGPVYLESLSKKLDENSKLGYFVITVDPWSIASGIQDPNNPDQFEENELFLASIKNVNSAPNLNYALNWFEMPFFEIIAMRYKNKNSKLHSDGWYETTGNMETNAVDKRRSFMVNFYNDFLTKYQYSNERFKYLQKTILYLQTKGQVFLVRMPLHHDILEIEERLDPKFGARMDFLSKKFGIPYFDFNVSDSRWEFKDGLHLTVESAKALSEELSQKILLSIN